MLLPLAYKYLLLQLADPLIQPVHVADQAFMGTKGLKRVVDDGDGKGGKER